MALALVLVLPESVEGSAIYIRIRSLPPVYAAKEEVPALRAVLLAAAAAAPASSGVTHILAYTRHTCCIADCW